ncbi:MAG: hypothetical protein HQ581_20565 [Planctomycetes bacterium]|nr:hypothetical protein [Planctomycetota bacterium]
MKTRTHREPSVRRGLQSHTMRSLGVCALLCGTLLLPTGCRLFGDGMDKNGMLEPGAPAPAAFKELVAQDKFPDADSPVFKVRTSH